MIFELVSAVGNAADHGAHGGLGSIEQLTGRRFETHFSELCGEALDACRADVKRGELRLQISPQNLRLADILQDDVADRLVELATFDNLHRRYSQAFLEDLRRARAVAARRGAADVEMVAQRADEPDAPAVAKHRLVGDDIGEMLASAVRVVRYDDVVGPPSVGRNVTSQDLGEEVAHRVEMARDARRLRNVPAVAVEDRGRVVEQFAHDGRAAGAPDGNVHFGGSGGQGVVDDLEFDRRNLDIRHIHVHSCLLATRWPLLSRRQLHPSTSRTLV